VTQQIAFSIPLDSEDSVAKGTITLATKYSSCSDAIHSALLYNASSKCKFLKHMFINIVHPALVLRPTCIPEKVGVYQELI
jgi:hypothetical protein